MIASVPYHLLSGGHSQFLVTCVSPQGRSQHGGLSHQSEHGRRGREGVGGGSV